MATLRASDLRRINQTFERFGRNPRRQLRLRWFDTRDLFYHVESSKERPQAITIASAPESKVIDLGAVRAKVLYVVSNDWVRHSWAERLGKGWVVARWAEPLPRELHIELYGSKAPWQPEGEYLPVENTFRPEDDLPNERNTALLVKLLLQMFAAGADPATHPALQRSKHSKQIFDALLAQHQHEEKQTVDTIMDEIDDIYPAFGKAVPGSRSGGVSIGGI